MTPLRIAITCGDPAGVGPELIQKSLSEISEESARFAAIGPQSWLDELRDALPDAFEGIAVGPKNFRAEPGKPTPEGAKLALEAMERAAAGCSVGEFDGVASGPISKERCAAVGFSHPGQTEYFASFWGGQPTMAFVGERLKVVLATWHIPLSQVARNLDEECLTLAIERANDLAIGMGCPRPRIGVCGLNPHAGENGLMGDEERSVFNPLIAHLRQWIPGVSDCQPGDTVFHRALAGEFDVVVSLYHDQGLAPLKTLEFHTAVNVSLGLPYVRTSPDHGTAYPIAGEGTASHESFLNAIRLAVRLGTHKRDSRLA